MAWFKYLKYFQESDRSGYDTFFFAGAPAPFDGIYRCEGCGREVGRAQAHLLPQPHAHPHTPIQGEIRWRLLAYADPEPKG